MASALEPATTQAASAPEEADTHNRGRIEVDDTDSAFDFSDASDTTSLKSEWIKYKQEHGRRYHAGDADYWGPNDDRQQEAEDLHHVMITRILGELNRAPISDPKRVLDVGCGTGSWAIDYADEYPSSEVIGVDLSPIQPLFVPPNCRFEVDDITKSWTFPENHFDLIYIRNMLGTVSDWTEFHQKVLRHLVPGGWVEQVELSTIMRSDDNTIPDESALAEWTGLFDEVGEKLGRTFRAAETAKAAMEAAGFANLKEEIIKVPIGPWAKDPTLKEWGTWSREFFLDGLEGFALRVFNGVLKRNPDETQLYLAEMRRNLKDRNIHVYTQLHVVYGQKP